MHGHRKPGRSSDAHAHAPHSPANGIAAHFKGLLALLCVAQLMVILDITAVNVALPDIANGLGIHGGTIAWAITSYSLVFGSLLLLGGRLAELVGRRRVFMTGLAVFTLASVAAASANSEAALFAARAAQGLGAALLSPAALSIIMATFTGDHQRAHALGVWVPLAEQARQSVCCSAER
jgi:MFS family permease